MRVLRSSGEEEVIRTGFGGEIYGFEGGFAIWDLVGEGGCLKIEKENQGRR